MAYDNNRKPTEKKKPKGAVDWSKLGLSVPCPSAQGKWSSITWAPFGQMIRLTLWTNDPEDSSKENGGGKIATSMDLITFFAFLKLFDKVLKTKGEIKYVMEGLEWFGFGGQKRDAPKVSCELIIGKSAEGVMQLMLTAPGRPKIMFDFIPSRTTHRFRHAGGDLFSHGETSIMYASAYYDVLCDMMDMDLVSQLVTNTFPDRYDVPEVKVYGGGGQTYSKPSNTYGSGGGQGSGGGGGGNYGERRDAPAKAPARETSEAEMDDDIPF